MPTSYPHQISKIVDFVMQVNPRSVLDIGVGFGKYGLLLREYLEIWGSTSGYGKFTRRIDGIEAHSKYLTPVHEYVYDEIFIGDARDIVPTLKRRYDLILLVDVLEHFDEEEGEQLLKKLLKRHRGVLVVTLKQFHAQEDSFENPFETHRSFWKRGDFSRIGAHLIVPDPLSWIVYFSDASSIRTLRRAYTWHRWRWRASTYPLLRKIKRSLMP